jgi:hypothetical protein
MHRVKSAIDPDAMMNPERFPVALTLEQETQRVLGGM